MRGGKPGERILSAIPRFDISTPLAGQDFV
jgi:hypothetical protein